MARGRYLWKFKEIVIFPLNLRGDARHNPKNNSLVIHRLITVGMPEARENGFYREAVKDRLKHAVFSTTSAKIRRPRRALRPIMVVRKPRRLGSCSLSF